MSTLRAAFHTLGCKTNHYETDALRQKFSQAGFAEVPFDSVAEVYLINTCTVTGEAGRKSRQMLRRARRVNPAALVVALGCHSELNRDLPDVDICIGTGGKMKALERISEVLGQRGVEMPNGRLQGEGEPAVYEEFGPVFRQSETRAYIKIEDGCDNYCTYCAIPLARGRVRSRQADAVLAEAVALASAGYREIVLTGIHICSYGADWGLPSHTVMELALKLADIDGIERIRLGSLEPQSITPEFIELAVRNPKLLPHFHLSLQSGCDDVLARMRRQYRTDLYRDVVGRLRIAFDQPGLTTDVIVGFPGETCQEHIASLAFCREIGFSRLHVFKYSRRDGTHAAQLPDQIDSETAADRSRELLKLADQMSLNFHSRQIGRSQAVLLEAKNKDGFIEGYTPEYVPVRLPSFSGFKPGQIVIAAGEKATSEFLYCR